MNRNTRHLPCWALALAALSACATSPEEQARRETPPIPKFESVAILNMGVSDELKARFGAAAEESSADSGALAGAGKGAMIGANVSQGCWDFTILCALVTVPVGAVIGAVGGGVAAHAAESQKEQSYEQLRVLDSLFAQILQQRTINQDIEHSLMQQIPPEHITDIKGADTLLQYRLYDVRFAMTSSKKYALTLKTVMLFGWNRNTPLAVSTHRTYAHSSQSLKVEDWVQDDGATLNQAFDACIAGLTEKMLADIQFENLQERGQSPFQKL